LEAEDRLANPRILRRFDLRQAWRSGFVSFSNEQALSGSLITESIVQETVTGIKK
jgi:hypothetical protein